MNFDDVNHPINRGMEDILKRRLNESGKTNESNKIILNDKTNNLLYKIKLPEIPSVKHEIKVKKNEHRQFTLLAIYSPRYISFVISLTKHTFFK
jgi:hypothetical protein